jgi:hypothetical protein
MSVSKTLLNFDAVRDIGLSLPNVVEGTAYGAPALKLRGKMLACVPVNKSAEANCAVVRIDFERRARLLGGPPHAYYVTDHYAPHPTVLVRLSRVTRAELRRLLQDAWNFVDSELRARRSRSAARRSLARAKGPLHVRPPSEKSKTSGR